MSEYSFVKKGKLNLKGGNDSKKKSQNKRKRAAGEMSDIYDEDALKHGGWWKINDFNEIVGNVAIEIGERCYLQSMDNGRFTLGPPRDIGDEPDPAEVFTAVRVNDTKIALKSGYGKFLSIDHNGVVVGVSDAIGPREQWEPVFQDGQVALLAFNNCFLSIDDDCDAVAANRTAGPGERLAIRSCAVKENARVKEIPVEERGDVKDTELNYVKKFQSFQDKKIRLNKIAEDLGQAKEQGRLHETLLDRREKMKADRHCK